MRRTTLLLVLMSLPLSACVDSRPSPDLIPQTKISYGPRIYLVDETIDNKPALDRCTRLTTVATTTTASAAGIIAVDFKPDTLDPTVPHNCYVDVQPMDLRVDQLEITNDLFQLCVDSGACKGPDPGESNKAQVCNIEDEFEQCAVVEVGLEQATAFCDWVGRRIPNGFEHLAIRQTNMDNQDPSKISIFPEGNDAPVSCDEAVIGENCQKPRPFRLGTDVAGAAQRDVVDGEGGKKVFDVVGNVSEWSTDMMPARRGFMEGWPWFCVGQLATSEPYSAANPPRCPVGSFCIRGQYQPAPDLPLRTDWPVCVTTRSGSFSGEKGSLFGGNYRDKESTRERGGIFGRRLENEPDTLPDTGRARGIGIRCVGDRQETAEGKLGDFDDLMVLTGTTT